MKYIRRFNESLNTNDILVNLQKFLDEIKDYYFIVEDEGMEIKAEILACAPRNEDGSCIGRFIEMTFKRKIQGEIVRVTDYNMDDILPDVKEFYNRISEIAQSYNLNTKIGSGEGKITYPFLYIQIYQGEDCPSSSIYNIIET